MNTNSQIILNGDGFTRKYLAVGFDDFRESDFSWVIPLFKKYDAHATFNVINRGVGDNDLKKRVNTVLENGHELGDHTILHTRYPYYCPLFNGQDPEKPDGNQIPFPSDEDFMKDRGDGRNAFGKKLDEVVDIGVRTDYSKWRDLTPEKCQKIRDSFSVIKDKVLGTLLDEFSNRWLGTKGRSLGSWNGSEYEEGIFTGCRTSCNHEVWERICEIQRHFFMDYLKCEYSPVVWSLPGGNYECLFFDREGKKYYDREMTILANDLGEMKSSLRNGLRRSWNGVLREYGYCVTHDSNFPGRVDGQIVTEQRYPFAANAQFAGRDSLLFPTKSTVFFRWPKACVYYNGMEDTPERKKLLYKMRGREEDDFFRTIENLRTETASGLIAEALWDSEDWDGQRVFWEELLRFCVASGIQVIPLGEAYRLCYRRTIDYKSIDLNSEFKNSAEDYFGKGNAPMNPDGYIGDCHAEMVNGERQLHVTGEVIHRQYGLKPGKHVLISKIKGEGTLSVFLILKDTPFGKKPCEEEKCNMISIKTDMFKKREIYFDIPSDGAMGLYIAFEGELIISSINLDRIY